MSPLSAWHSCLALYRPHIQILPGDHLSLLSTSVGFLNLSKVHVPLQTVGSRSISSMHIWSFPAYIQEYFQLDIYTLCIKFASFHHTKFHTQRDGIIIITIISFSHLFFNFNACLLKKERT
jgi:hypothetical protein